MIPVETKPCAGSSADVKERTPGKATHALRARLSQLENALQAHNIELPPESPGDHALCDQVSARRRSAQSIPSSRSSDTSPHARVDPTLPSNNTIQCAEPRESVPSPTTLNPFSANHHVKVQNLEAIEHPGEAQANLGSFEAYRNLDDATPLNIDSSPSPRLTNYSSISQAEPTDPDNITSSLAARMGSLQIAEDGQLRYYGPTSNLHLYHAGLHSLARSTIRHVATEGAQALARAGLDHPVAPDVERHLAELYFAWEDPAIHVVDEEVFFLEKRKWKSGQTNTPYYSETLNSAMQVSTSTHPERLGLTHSAVQLGPVWLLVNKTRGIYQVPSSSLPGPRPCLMSRWTVPVWRLSRHWSS